MHGGNAESFGQGPGFAGQRPGFYGRTGTVGSGDAGDVKARRAGGSVGVRVGLIGVDERRPHGSEQVQSLLDFGGFALLAFFVPEG